MSQIEIPTDLIEIRAFVRWEEAGKPEDTSPEWQAAEYARARLDLQLEALSGVSLNDMRRRYNQDTVDGDDDPMFPGVDANAILTAGKNVNYVANPENNAVAVSVDEWNDGDGDGGEFNKPTKTVEPEVWIEPEPEPVGVYQSTRGPSDLKELTLSLREHGDDRDDELASAQSKTFMTRWAGEGPGKRLPEKMINQRVYPIGKDAELLVQMYQVERSDEEAMSGARSKVARRRVVFTTDATEDLVLHWGVARDEPGQWLLPPKALWPEGTEIVSEISVETPLLQTEGCLPVQGVDGNEDDDACYPIQTMTIDLPGEGPLELMGMQFVIRNADGTSWYKDEFNGNSNFRANYAQAREQAVTDEMLDTIIRAEAGNGWWTLMHRFNLASSLIEQKCGAHGSLETDGKKTRRAEIAAAAKIYVWLRYSSQRKLTWQRNYNVKPRELSAAQSKLTRTITDVYRSSPHLRDIARLMLGTVGRGGEGGQGQQIRDEILNIMHRNNIGERKGVWMEEWHQKLHNNTTPDDIVICEAYLAFLKSDMDVSEYWRVLSENGVTRERLESFERPIKVEPTPRPHIKVALIKDFTNYLAILKSVHSGADLVECLKAASRKGLAVSHAMNYVRVAQNGGGDALQLLAACVDARHEIRDAGLANPYAADEGLVRELMYLDLAVDDVSRRAVERAGEADYGLDEQMYLAELVGENLALSLPSTNEDVVLALTEWRRVREAKTAGDATWALRAKAVVDRVRLSVSLHADAVANDMQPAANEIGRACGIESWSVDLFAEEVIRGGPAFALSLVLSRLDPALRAEADMGAWQIISPDPAIGFVKRVDALASVMNDTFDRPTILIADKMGGDEEIPAGAVAVLTTCSVDVLSHSAVRARNGGVLFATCYDEILLENLSQHVGDAMKVSVGKGEQIVWEEVDASAVDAAAANGAAGAESRNHIEGGLRLDNIPFCGKYTVPLSEFKQGVVGAKARNTRALNESLGGGKIPKWIRLPKSMVVPFGTLEHILKDPINASVARELMNLEAAVDDSSEESLATTLKNCRACVRTVQPPKGMLEEISTAMAAAGIDPPEDEDRWDLAWRALCDVWASKWNDRAFVSLRNHGIDHADLRMSVLVQPVVDADYAFVIHTVNPSSNDATELYAEVVVGLGEVLVGNYPGRALSFSVKKATAAEAATGTKYLADGATPKVLGYPSKNVLLKIPRPTIIFRSDSNGEDLEGYAGAGLYESVPMDKESTLHADYSGDALVWDAETQRKVLTKIAEAGVAIEAALGGVAQDIEGVVKDGEIYVVQTRPQV